MKLIPVSLYDVAAQQAFLEDEALRGRFLTGYTGYLAWFERGKPKAVRYRLEPLRRRDELPDPDRLEAYRALGWTYVTRVEKAFHVWRCDDPAAPELDTDPEVRAAAYDYQCRRLRRANGCVAAIWLGVAVLVLAVHRLSPGGFLTGQLESEAPLWRVLPLYATVGFLLWQLVYWDWSLRRFLRTLRAGVPVPQRRPYRLSRCLTAVALALYGLYMVTLTAALFQPRTRSFLSEAELGEPVPYVALADAGEVLALPRDNWLTREQWWILQLGAGDAHRAESHYYDLWFPALAEPYTEETRERFDLRPIPGEKLDGAWWTLRDDGFQVLLVCRGGRVMETCYDGEEDLRDRVDDYAALLAEK